MTSSNRSWPLVWLVGILVLAYLVTILLNPLNSIFSFLLLAFLGVTILMLALGAGWREADPGYAVLRKDSAGNLQAFTEGYYLFIPFFHVIKAVMPNYPLRYEGMIENIQTRTFRLARLEKVRMRVNYRIINHSNCYKNLVPTMADHIRELEQHKNLKRTDTELWCRAIDHALHTLLDDSVRDEIWAWAGNLEQDDRLSLQTPFPAPAGAEYDPYGLSLNRVKLAQKVCNDINRVVARYGLRVEHIVFELIEVNNEFLKARTQNKERELASATHVAALEAAAIREKGFAEADVRARNLARLLNELINVRGLTMKDPLVAEIVRASLYSDGEMIWNGVIEKSTGSGPTKAA